MKLVVDGGRTRRDVVVVVRAEVRLDVVDSVPMSGAEHERARAHIALATAHANEAIVCAVKQQLQCAAVQKKR